VSDTSRQEGVGVPVDDEETAPGEEEAPAADSQRAEWAEQLVRDHADHGQAEPHGEEAGQPGAVYQSREQQVLDRIERARQRKPKLKEDKITLAHGAGGKATSALIEALFLPAFDNPELSQLEDQALLDVGDGQRVAFTTDSFVVKPLFFPGGSIGDLAVNGTVNDLAVSGAIPRWLSASFIIEEGFAVEDLRRIIADMRAAAEAVGVEIVTGDTKVVGKASGDGCYINTAGVGVVGHDRRLGARQATPGDAVLVSGPIGQHGMTVMLARGEVELDADFESDTAPLHDLVATLLEAAPGVRCMRDATRGGVATVLNEVAQTSQTAVVLDEAAIPVREDVHGACEMLGIEPMYVACEGRMVVVVDGDQADAALEAMQSHELGQGAARVGTVGDDPPGLVLLQTTFGGTRIVDELVGDPLPRIC
jgi:hydrogenase expression/formation protein HypE